MRDTDTLVPEPAEGSEEYDPTEEFEQIWRDAYMAALTEDEPLTEEGIAASAQVEREIRITALAKHSASQLVPNVQDHYQINRLLNEWEVNR